MVFFDLLEQVFSWEYWFENEKFLFVKTRLIRKLNLIANGRRIEMINDLTMIGILIIVFAVFWGFTIFCEKA
ncbi:hypothetical protein GCM10007380_29950 [Gottfriedia solisilvae]|uniref:Uncharacterized protein n=1 Tax=Gottfriedia solisilvae TaxID=1516104 RepID=A0A8J3AJW7_9BACI|nr:hypothetical protein GCM10007380_29950 [Gottfriedia solisilvae]